MKKIKFIIHFKQDVIQSKGSDILLVITTEAANAGLLRDINLHKHFDQGWLHSSRNETRSGVGTQTHQQTQTEKIKWVIIIFYNSRYFCVESDKKGDDLEAIKKDIMEKVNDAARKADLADIDLSDPTA